MSARKNHHHDYNDSTKGRAIDWEDKYHREKEKVDALKVELKEKDNNIKLFQTKIRRLEADLNRIDHAMGVPRRDPDEDQHHEAVIVNLKTKLTQMKNQNHNFATKQKEILEQVDRLKREKANLIRRQNSQSSSGRKAPPSTMVEAVPSRTTMKHQHHQPPQQHQPPPHTESPSDPNLLKILQAMKTELASVKDELAHYKEEARSENHFPPPHMSKQYTEAAADSGAARESQWKLQQLQTQYDYLHSKYSSQETSHKNLNLELSDYQQKVRDLRHALEDLRHEKELSDGKANRVASLQETIEELRVANHDLEKKYTHLSMISATPGDNGSTVRGMQRYDFELLAKERDDYKARVEHLQEAVRTHFSALTSLKQQAAKLREEKDAGEKRAAELQDKFRDLKTGNDLTQDQLRLYSGDEGLDIESLEKAITIVKRRQEAFERLSFLESPDEERIDTIPLMKKKLEHHQHLNVKLTSENEKLESMLALQSKINKDLHKEIEALVVSRGFDKREMQQQIQDYERLSTKRLEVIHKLEAQVRQLVYGKNASSEAPSDKGGDALTGENAPLREEYSAYDGLLDAKSHNLKPDENILEVWVKAAMLLDGQLMPGSSSFAVIDFFDYESQATPVLSGMRPKWDFAATYRLTIDDFLIRYFATECCTIELNMAAQGDYSLIGRCTVSLAALLRTKPVMKLAEFPIQSVTGGQLIGHMNVELRLALPISELYNLYLERHPDQKEVMQKAVSIHPLAGAGQDASVASSKASSMNQLEITIHRASNLPINPVTNTPPTSYVHFQFLGHPDKFTNAVPISCEPEFDETFMFPMSTDPHQLTLLERSKIQFSLVDIKTEDTQSDAGGGLIGEVFLSLASLVDGTSMADVYGVQDSHGKKVADVQISIRWKRAFSPTK